MSNDDKKKDKESGADDLRSRLEEMFGGFPQGGFSFPGSMASASEEKDSGSESAKDTLNPILDFDLLPRDIKRHLDRFVIRQEEAKKALAIAVCDHYNHARLQMQEAEGKNLDLQKQNVMVVGPTGVGKTYLVKHIAELIGVPFVKADATKFSETGYVGGDVDDLVRELVAKAGGNIELAEFGIIYIDEIDKLASRTTQGGMGRDVSGRGVQTTLLKLMEETEVPARNPQDMRGQMMAMMDLQRGGKEKDTINTKHILFIVSGAFSGLEEIIRKRSSPTQIGFSADQLRHSMDVETFREVSTQDFIDFGFEAEFIGRLPVRVVCEHLSSSDLESILKFSEGSLLRQYEREFGAYGIEISFKDSGIKVIAEMAEKERTGARGLMTVMEGILREFKFELPGTQVKELCVDETLINERDKRILEYREMGKGLRIAEARDDVQIFCDGFRADFGVEIAFTDSAIDSIVELAAKQARTPLQVMRDLFRDYQFGLKLIHKNTGVAKFPLDVDAVDAPDDYLSKMVVESYGDKP